VKDSESDANAAADAGSEREYSDAHHHDTLIDVALPSLFC
jgi:hypothetical protein